MLECRADAGAASPESLYNAWLNSEEHAAMTGAQALAAETITGEFSAWDGYITGRNIDLQSGKRILQSWHTSEFDSNAPDSLLEVLFEPEGKGTRVKIRHKDLPAEGMKYKQGWIDHYFEPMKEYFKS